MNTLNLPKNLINRVIQSDSIPKQSNDQPGESNEERAHYLNMEDGLPKSHDDGLMKREELDDNRYTLNTDNNNLLLTHMHTKSNS